MSSSEAIAVLDRVSYLYPRSSAPVLHDISLEIRRGEFLGLIGPTGAGKTTLCLALNGIVPQFYGGRFFGHATVAGLDTVDHPISDLARHVGMVFEDPESQLVATSVENEIAFALENLKLPPPEIRERINWALAAVRLEGQEQRWPHELSGGQKQRLAIAAALALRPELLVLDEPTSQLDPLGAREVYATVRELNRRYAITVVMAGHAAEEMAEYADRIALLAEGKIQALGTPEMIFPQIERLESHDLRPPQVTEAFHRIRARGLPVPRLPVRLEEARDALPALYPVARIEPPALPPAPRPPAGPPLLAAHELHHTYHDGAVALRGVSIEIRAGEYVLIAGQNGAGKSTLVKHFLSLLKPTAGRVTVDGIDTGKLSVARLARRIGYVAQNPDRQIFNITVEEEVAFALRYLGYSAMDVEARVWESLQSLDLLNLRDRHPLALPRGDRVRVVVAAVLALHPEILIFDEPTTGQDYRGARAILEITRKLHQAGKTVIVITHHLHLMPDYAHRMIVMGQGTLLLDAPLRRAYHELTALQQSQLTPPQAVWLARELAQHDGRDYPLLTPQEVAAAFSPRPEAAR